MDLEGAQSHSFASLLEIIVHSALKTYSLTYRLVEFPMTVSLASEPFAGGSSLKVSLTAIFGRTVSANV